MIQWLHWLMICSTGNSYGASLISLHHSSKILFSNILILWDYLVASCFILKKCSIRSERQIIVYLPRALNCGQLYGRPWDKTRNALINIPLEFTYPSNFTSLVICTPWAILVGEKEKPFEFSLNNIRFIFIIKLFLFFSFSFSVRSFLPLLWPCWGVGSAEGPQGRVGIGHRWNPRTNSLEGKPLESENWKLYWTGHWQWKKNNFHPFILFGNNNS